MRCAIHPNVETVLRCGRCGQFICPKCMVMTPVGARCPKCARVSRLPTYSLSLSWYLRATGASLLGAVVLGLIWGLLATFRFVGLFGFFIAAGAGYLIGEITSRAVNRKRGNWLAIIGCLGFMLSYFISGGSFSFWLPSHFSLFQLAAIAIGLFLAQSRLR
jgi:hypothetical protein